MMFTFNVYNENYKVYSVDDFPFEYLANIIELKNKSVRSKTFYYDTIATFDTETTTYRDGDDDKGFMYIWGFYIHGLICVGNYGHELGEFVKRLHETFKLDKFHKFLIWVHNYPFDFAFTHQFISRALGFYPEIFATSSRRVIKANWKGLEFRCSYKLTNMSLEKFCKFELGCTKRKFSGDLDYSAMRTPANFNYNNTEWSYFLGDLICLADAMENKIKNDDLNLLTLPLTSTGYIRDYLRLECFKDYSYKRWFWKLGMTELVYSMCKLALRGGDTHENRFYQNILIDEEYIEQVAGYLFEYLSRSRDYKSSYPYAICCFDGFPISQFVPYGELDSVDEFMKLMDRRCCLFFVEFEHIIIKPYNPKTCISVSKILHKEKIDIVDNGRLVEGHGIKLACNEIDFLDILDNYDFDGFEITNLHVAKKGRLPKVFTDAVFKLFEEKCKLELIKESDLEYEYLYAKFKNKLNACFGAMLTDICQPETSFDFEKLEWMETPVDIQEHLNKYFKNYNSFLYYPVGLYITSFCRHRLYQLIDCCEHPEYWDTDSCKGFGWDEEKVNKLNNDTIENLKELDYVVDIDGRKFYLGFAELDDHGGYKRFKGMGAKKYAFEDLDGNLHITIAGVNKKKGAIELAQKGGLDVFKDNFTFIEAGSICAKYEDAPIHLVTVDGETFEVASNVALVPTTYTLSRPDDYLKRANFTIYERRD